MEVVGPDLVLLTHERGWHVLEGRLFPLLVPWLDGRHDLGEIVDALEGRANALDVRWGLEALLERGVLIDARENGFPDLAVFRDSSGIDPALFRDRLVNTTVAVRSVGGVPTAGLVSLLRSLHVNVSEGASLEAVLTDDYLADELGSINAAALRAGRPWMIVRPTGTVAWLGPIFDSQRGACWDCLAKRLRENQPLAEDAGTSRAAIPMPNLVTSEQMALAASATQLLRWVTEGRNEELEGRLITLDTHTMTTRSHRVVKIAHCEACGTPRAEVPPMALDRGDGDRIVSRDGGYRAIAPEETLRRHARHVSPITGVVSELAPLPTDRATAMRVWVAEHLFGSAGLDRETPYRGGRRKSTGKGTTDLQAQTSALCEALERYSGVFRGDEPRTHASFNETSKDAVHPESCLNYSSGQLLDRNAWNAQGSRWIWVGAPFDETRPIDWSPVWSLTRSRQRYLPTAYCYYGYPVDPDHEFCRADSNGAAAGNTVTEAILQGFLELVERDAVGVWWYNRLERPGVALASFESSFFDSIVREHRRIDREVGVLDLTHDLEIPVFAAVSIGPRGGAPPIFGFGAHFEPEIAISRALTEMSQFLPGLLSGSSRGLFHGPLEDDRYLRPNQTVPPLERKELRCDPPGNVGDAVARCVSIASKRDFEILVLDQTRPDVGLRVVKVVVPGLRHYWPRLGPGRLFDVPVERGWLDAPRDEKSLNPAHITI